MMDWGRGRDVPRDGGTHFDGLSTVECPDHLSDEFGDVGSGVRVRVQKSAGNEWPMKFETRCGRPDPI
jgi:hypothetical protein